MNHFLSQSKASLFLLASLFLGGAIGLIFGERAVVLEPIGQLFLNMMFVIIVPLVFFSISTAIANMSSMARLGRIMRTVLCVFVGTALLAALIAYIGTQWFQPFAGVDLAGLAQRLPAPPNAQSKAWGELLVDTFSVSDFSLLLSRAKLLPLIVFAIIFGLATASAGDAAQGVKTLLNSINAVILRMVHIIMLAAPIGLSCYFAATVGVLGPQIVSAYWGAFVLYVLLTIVYFFGANTLYAWIAGGRLGVQTFWAHVLTPAITAMATSSSAACIPVNLLAAQKMGVPKDIADTVIPLGANTHKDGSVIGGMIKIVFLMTLFGQSMSDPMTILAMIAVSFLVGAVMGAIPGGGMTGELLICAIFGFPPEVVGTIMIISTIIDIPATLLNSTGNTVCAMLVARFVEGKDWLSKRVLA